MVVQDALSELAEWKDLIESGVLGFILWWIVAKVYPKSQRANQEAIESIVNKHDKAMRESRIEFHQVIRDIESSRREAAREGHEAAKNLTTSIDRNSEAIEHLSERFEHNTARP